MATTTICDGIRVDNNIYAFVNDEVLAGVGIVPDSFWQGFAAALRDLTPRNRALLARRHELHEKISAWHRERRGTPHDAKAHKAFLREIGYIAPAGDAFTITTENCDDEIARVAGPQLVVPVLNARYALNAANARWGSLYDAFYGTDALGHAKPGKGGGIDPAHLRKMRAHVHAHLDKTIPLTGAGHADVECYTVEGGTLCARIGGKKTRLKNPAQFRGYRGKPDNPASVLLAVNGLHLELVINRKGEVGGGDKAGVDNVIAEAALSTIVDFEDSVAAVDAADKLAGYRNWLGLMRGDLTTTINKGGRKITRRLLPDRQFTAPDGRAMTLHGRALLLVRNTGHLMRSPAILDAHGDEVFEGIMDAFITTAIALYDLRGSGRHKNTRRGSVYIVKPKMHSPDEVAFADTLFARVEACLGLPAATIKIGLMDEERRMSVNLAECIRAAAARVAFINTGFLDRTGDEIHTNMEAGVMIRKAEMKQTEWLAAYEDRNVDTGLACGLAGRAQIGKGMWAMPDHMADMLEQKIAHPRAGANTAWVPSPTAAILHATHYHLVNVAEVQRTLMGGNRAGMDSLLALPLAEQRNWSDAEITAEVENNAQGILGYVVRWINDGVGCSKVPDINDTGLMEDRATLRISSLHIANWLRHGIVSRKEVMAIFRRMAAVVDKQNAHDKNYRPMTADLESSIAFAAACDLVFLGAEQPSGYTEPILHRRRAEYKARHGG